MTPTIKLFRKKFCVRDKLAIDGYALLLLKVTVKNLEQFILSEIQKAREEVLDEVEKACEEKQMKNTPPELIPTGYNLALTDLQHHISKMKDNKTDV